MEKEFINFNMILCEGYNDATKTISQVFNKITTNSSKRGTFTLITFINAVGEIEEEDFTLHYYLVEKKFGGNGKRRGVYLGASSFTKNGKEEYKDAERLSGTNNTFADIEFEDVPFISEGEHLIEAYKVSGSIGQETFEELKNNWKIYREIGKLVSVTGFQVRFPDK